MPWPALNPLPPDPLRRYIRTPPNSHIGPVGGYGDVHIVNRTGRREHAVAWLLIGLIAGAAGLIAAGGLTPPTLEKLGPFWANLFFGWTFISSSIALAGIFVPWHGVKGLLIESAGLWLQSAAWIGYGLVVYALQGSPGAIFAIVVCGMSIAHIVRAVRIPGEARALAALAVQAGVQLQEEV